MSEVVLKIDPLRAKLEDELVSILAPAMMGMGYLEVEGAVQAALRCAKANYAAMLKEAWVLHERALRADPDPE